MGAEAPIPALIPALTKPSDCADEAQPDSSREVVKEQNGSTPRPRTWVCAPEHRPLMPSKPPIRDEDGLVEVGWEGDLEDEIPGPRSPRTIRAALVADESPDKKS